MHFKVESLFFFFTTTHTNHTNFNRLVHATCKEKSSCAAWHKLNKAVDKSSHAEAASSSPQNTTFS